MNIRLFYWIDLLRKYTAVHQLPLLKTLVDVVRYKIRYELSIEEQIQSALYLPSAKKNPGERMVARTKIVRILKRLNAYPVDMIVDKGLFTYYAKAMNALTPKTLLVFESSKCSDHCHGRTQSGQIITSKKQWLRFLRANLGAGFIVKAALGDGGRDIGVFRMQEDGRYLSKNEYYTVEEIYNEIAIKRAYGKCVVQEIAENHEEVVKVTGSKTLQCLRILTVKSRAGGIQLFSVAFKIAGNPTNDTDHFHLGATGNLYAVIDKQKKSIENIFSFDYKRLEFTKMNHHPFTGEKLKGWKVPLIEESIQLAIDMHRGLSSLQAIGWDIAVTPDGPMVIEGNSLWGSSGRYLPYFSEDDLKSLMEVIATETLLDENVDEEAA